MPRRIYTTDFKVAAAELVTEQGYGNKTRRLQPGVPPGTLQEDTGSDATAGPGRRPPAAAADDPAALKAELGRLRGEPPPHEGARGPKKRDGLLRQREGLRFGFIRDHRDEFPVAARCAMS